MKTLLVLATIGLVIGWHVVRRSRAGISRRRVRSILGVLGIAAAIAIFVRSADVSSEPTLASSSSDDPESHDPFKPQDPGPSAIPYDRLSDADRTGIDRIHEIVETSQPASSYDAFARATSWTGAHAEQQIAARHVGLTGTEDDGVVP